MIRLFIDTNIVLDLLIRAEYKTIMRDFIIKTADKELCISYLAVANAAYIMRKYPKEELRRNIQLILKLFTILPNERVQIENAIKCISPDFEDMLQYQTAIGANCHTLITRNAKDYPFSEIPVMSAEEYLDRY